MKNQENQLGNRVHKQPAPQPRARYDFPNARPSFLDMSLCFLVFLDFLDFEPAAPGLDICQAAARTGGRWLEIKKTKKSEKTR